MNTETHLIGLVRQIIDAENEGGEGGRSKADLVLAHNFTRITRSSGQEQGRDDLLKAIAIASAGDANPLRVPIEREFWPLHSDSVGVVHSLVATHGRSDPKRTLSCFRNTHVFEKQDGAWRCVAWQVTRLQEPFIGPDDDYKIKLDYLKSQFQRLLTRFNYFLTVEMALFGVVGLLTFERSNAAAVRVPALLGVFVSVIWYVAAAEDHALVKEYRERAKRSADRLGGPFARDHPAMEVGKRCNDPLSWYWRPLSVTSLPVIVALATLFLWVLLLAFGPTWLAPYMPRQ